MKAGIETPAIQPVGKSDVIRSLISNNLRNSDEVGREISYHHRRECETQELDEYWAMRIGHAFGQRGCASTDILDEGAAKHLLY